MSDLVRNPSGTFANVPASFDRGEAKSLTRQQNAEIARGLVTSTRIQSAGLAAGAAIQMTAMLSREAEFLADGNPQTAARLNFVADSFAEYAAWEVRRMNR